MNRFATFIKSGVLSVEGRPQRGAIAFQVTRFVSAKKHKCTYLACVGALALQIGQFSGPFQSDVLLRSILYKRVFVRQAKIGSEKQVHAKENMRLFSFANNCNKLQKNRVSLDPCHFFP